MFGDYKLITQGDDIYIEHHQPTMMDEPFHVHPSIEINFLQGCEMDYSFDGRIVSVPQDRFCIFWAAQPHRVTGVRGKGTITNAYISLEEFWRWGLPQRFVDQILAGAVVAAHETLPCDIELARRLASESTGCSYEFQRLHCLEIQSRITRLALMPWEQIVPPQSKSKKASIATKSVAHFEKMVRYIAINYADAITLGDVAGAADVSENYANTLFKKIMGTTVKAHITSVRINRARMLLAETDAKVISIAHDIGFRSLSAFYEAFHRKVDISPAEFRVRVKQRIAHS
jgi:AraC-like DNA-binding protein